MILYCLIILKLFQPPQCYEITAIITTTLSPLVTTTLSSLAMTTPSPLASTIPFYHNTINIGYNHRITVNIWYHNITTGYNQTITAGSTVPSPLYHHRSHHTITTGYHHTITAGCNHTIILSTITAGASYQLTKTNTLYNYQHH